MRYYTYAENRDERIHNRVITFWLTWNHEHIRRTERRFIVIQAFYKYRFHYLAKFRSQRRWQVFKT